MVSVARSTASRIGPTPTGVVATVAADGPSCPAERGFGRSDDIRPARDSRPVRSVRVLPKPAWVRMGGLAHPDELATDGSAAEARLLAAGTAMSIAEAATPVM